MRSMNHSKVKFWSDHLAAAARHPAGIGAYCKEHGLSATMYYKWKTKLHQGKGDKPSAFFTRCRRGASSDPRVQEEHP